MYIYISKSFCFRVFIFKICLYISNKIFDIFSILYYEKNNLLIFINCHQYKVETNLVNFFYIVWQNEEFLMYNLRKFPPILPFVIFS